MKHGAWAAIGAVLVAGTLIGCGGEYAGTGSDGVASGAAVSGSAVSGAAVEVKKENETYNTHRFCNDTHLYYISGTYEYEENCDLLMERRLSDGEEQKYKMPGEYNKLCYVDNDWVYYANAGEEGEDLVLPVMFWRAPLEEKAGEKWVNFENAEMLFEEKGGIYDKYTTYCDGRYMAYMQDGTFEMRKYDIQKKRYVKDIRTGDGVSEGLFPKGRPYSFTIDGDNIFYLSYSEERETEDVCQCYRPDGSQKVVLTEKQIKERLEEEKAQKRYPKEAELCVEGLFVRGNRLYCQVFVCWRKEKVDYRNMVIFSQEIGGNGQLELEEELNRCLVNPEKDQKVFRKYWANGGGSSNALFLSRGACVGMTEEYAFLVLYDSEQKDVRLACFDFKSGSYQFINESDEEWYIPYYDGYHPIADGVFWGYAIPDNL